MNFWKFSVGGFILVMIEKTAGLSQLPSAALMDWRRGPGADQILIYDRTRDHFGSLDRNGNDGPTLIGSALAAAKWKIAYGQAVPGVVHVQGQCLSYYPDSSGVGIVVPQPIGENDFDYYGRQHCIESGVLPLEAPREASWHQLRRADAHCFYIDSSLWLQGRVTFSPEGALCGYSYLRQRQKIQGPALAISPGGRCRIQEKGRALSLSMTVSLIEEGTMFEK